MSPLHMVTSLLLGRESSRGQANLLSGLSTITRVKGRLGDRVALATGDAHWRGVRGGLSPAEGEKTLGEISGGAGGGSVGNK